jgi:hypothetical protein
VLSWPVAFAVTLAVETPIYLVLLGPDVGRARAVLGALVVNLATHPALWFAGTAASDGYRTGPLVGAELLVCVVEWLVLLAMFRRRVGAGDLAIAAIAANVASALVGLLF